VSNEIIRQIPAKLDQGDTAWILQQYESGQLDELRTSIPPEDWEAFGIALRNGDANGARIAVSRYEHFQPKPDTTKRGILWVVLAVLVIGAIVAGVIIWLSGNDDDSSPADTTAAATTAAPETSAAETTVALPTIGDIVRNDPRLSILNGYAVQAGLTGNLTGSQDFTLFAPTNEAFQAAQASTSDLAAITSDQKLLTQILTYHVVEGVLAPLPDEAVKSLEGSDLTVNGSSDPNKVNTASVLEAVPASNGVVYVINEVLIPPNFVPPTTAATTTEPPTTTTVALQNIPDTLVSLGQYSTLTSLLAATGLTPVLAGAGPFTLWAPTDEAFQALPPATVQALTANTDLLRQVLLYHVLQGAAAGADLTSRAYRTVQGEDIQVVVGDPIVVNGTSQVVQPNVLASNGVIYGINQVLIPPNVTIP
jgi:transforming growth factor-beta-induced protein